MTIRILTIAVILCILFGSGCTNAKPKYDAGIAAYERTHYQVALSDFESRAMKGDPVAQFCLGFMYKHGKGGITSEELAEEWYTKAAEQGYVPAQINLVAMYANRAEDEVRKISDALEELERVEALESSVEKLTSLRNISVEELASAFERLTSSHGAATQWTMEAADSPSARYNLALFHISFAAMHTKVSELSPQEPKDSNTLAAKLRGLAVALFERAAAKDYAPAQNELAKIYRDGLLGVTSDPEKALELFEKAATPNSDTADPYKKGYAPAQFSLALMYYHGKGIYKNLTEPERWKEAAKWYEKAAQKEYAPAQFNLAIMYEKGQGVGENLTKPERLKEAVKWYKMAANQEDLGAQNNLAIMYKKGQGVDKNLEIAARWYFRSAQQGQRRAQENLGRMFEEGLKDKNGEELIAKDNAEAYYWYSLASNDNSDAEIVEALERIGNQLDDERKNEIRERVKNWKPRTLVNSGTGFYIDEKHILTNAHVARPNRNNKYDELRVGYRYVEETSGAEAVNYEVDLALLYDNNPLGDIDIFATFRSAPVEFGEDIVSFGYPNIKEFSYGGNVTPGIVSGLSGALISPRPDNDFQHTAPIQGGNSGGPIFDRTGHVVGVSVSALGKAVTVWGYAPQTVTIDPYQNVNFAIKFDVVENFLRRNDITPTILPEDLDNTISKEKIAEKARKFTVPVLLFKNKAEEPLPMVEMSINDINN